VPSEKEGVVFELEALDKIYEFTGGYPYFIQEFASAVWLLADESPITVEDVIEANKVYLAKLDSSFYRVRLDRATELEVSYMRAMAELGSGPQQAVDVAKLLQRTTIQCGPTRAGLIEKGLLYTPTHGYAAFTMPHFDSYMRRVRPKLEIKPIKTRNKSN
jgi:hypothetical protein